MNQLKNPFVEQQDDDEGEIDLRFYYNVVNRNKWTVLGLAVLTTLLATLFVLNLTPIYRATASLLIESQQGRLVSIDELYGLDTGQRNYFQTQVAILQSRQLSEQVVSSENIDFASYASFNPTLNADPPWWERYLPFLASDPVAFDEERLHKHMAAVFRRGLTVMQVPGTDIIDISFDSPDRELAMRVANLVGEIYIESQLEARLELTQKATYWLTERLEALREKLDESEAALQKFQEEERLVESGSGSVRSLTMTELNSISSDLTTTRQKRIETERVFQQVQRLVDGDFSSLVTHPAILSDPGVASARKTYDELDRRVSELSERYGPKHPKMIGAVAELNASRQQVDQQAMNAIERLEETYEALLANERNLVSNEERARTDIQGLRRKEFRLAELKRNVETDRQLYNTFFTRFKETNATEGLQAANARVADPAVLPGQPIRPRTTFIITLVFFASLAAGIALAFLREYLDNTIKDGRDVEEKLGLPMLGLVPFLSNRDAKTSDRCSQLFLNKDYSNFAEAIRTIRTSVLLSALDDPHKVVVVTSSVPGEGKTTLSYNLAIALGQMEKILLIDADMRRPSIAVDSGLSNRDPGLSNYVAGTSTQEECIYTMKEAGIDVMPAGLVPPNPLELLSSKHFKDAIRDLEDKYDRIVIDSAPSQAVSDAMVLSTIASALIYVVKADATSRQIINSGIKRLQRVNAPMIGTVLNQFNAENAQRYGYYASGYYDYYGYKSEGTT